MKNLARGSITTHLVVRVLISSYFIAVAVGLIQGTDVTVLTKAFLPAAVAEALPRIAMFALAVLILAGVQRRGAALLLALMVFWASYMGLMSSHDAAALGGFWRDLALIGALVLTYADTETAPTEAGTAFVRSISRVSPALGESTAAALRSISRPRSRLRSRDLEEKKEIFREDLSAVRSTSS